MAGEKRKKFHDKDKYYRCKFIVCGKTPTTKLRRPSPILTFRFSRLNYAVAKEQGLRSRAAFKLSQINRRFPVLETCKHAVLDLCAAPGGWTQIAQKTCAKNVQIIAVDILPIRALAAPNVTTLIGDITTEKCKADIRRTLVNTPVDVVLHDGAPNIGAEYGKDAYAQNEIALHALKCATQHLQKGGTFITKIYRSRDYASYHWVLQQLFATVSALKPKASRAASAEIFLIAQNYKAPIKLDPKFLDPKHVFANVEGETTGGVLGGGSQAVTIFNKNWDKKVRKRGGYDMEHLDATMRHVTSATSFVDSAGLNAAVQILSESTGLAFSCEVCRETKEEATCLCDFYLHHPLTSIEIKECCSDLQVLNKHDFKGLLAWRIKMQEAVKAKNELHKTGDESNEQVAPSDGEDSNDSEKEEEIIQGEIEQMRQRRLREKKRKKKKERAVAAKRRRHAALGMDLNAIDVPDNDKIFSLTSLSSRGDLEAISEVNLDRHTDAELFGDSDDEVIIGEDSDVDSDDEARLIRREKELDVAYNSYLQNTKNGLAKSGTKHAKRSKKLQRIKVAEEVHEDQEMALTSESGMNYDTQKYAEMLQGPKDSDDDDDSTSDEDGDDGFDDEPMTPDEHAIKKRKTQESNPLIHKFADESTSVKTARWFSNPLFASIGEAAESALAKDDGVVSNDSEDDNDLEASNVKASTDVAANRNRIDKGKGKQVATQKSENRLTAEDVLSMIPKTDKQVRHERRLKQMDRDERKKARRARELGEQEGDFELAPANDESSDDDLDKKLEHLSEQQRKQIREANAMIKAGLGTSIAGSEKENDVEIVPQDERPLPLMDTRKYDSDYEDYDSDDYAQTLALGTMMLRQSKEKAFVDASYNRYAWNDPEDLPEWFVDDENKHYRPQLPIPPALIAKMKEKMLALSTKPIAKVAEARARKSKRAKQKLAVAKKKAEAVANSSEMSESMKLKAISKALRGQESKKPGKQYIVAKKGRANKGTKGAKVVDKRMKSDKRAMDRVEKKKRKGKQNGLVGSKKRRNHS
jgi:AdoMet-dependent rRNA methyltransferase SPB1